MRLRVKREVKVEFYNGVKKMSGKKVDPLMMMHHIGVGGALGVLQWYIWQWREKGIFIIVMFLLMNASYALSFDLSRNQGPI